MKTREPDRGRPGQAPLLSEIFSDPRIGYPRSGLRSGGQCPRASESLLSVGLSRRLGLDVLSKCHKFFGFFAVAVASGQRRSRQSAGSAHVLADWPTLPQLRGPGFVHLNLHSIREWEALLASTPSIHSTSSVVLPKTRLTYSSLSENVSCQTILKAVSFRGLSAEKSSVDVRHPQIIEAPKTRKSVSKGSTGVVPDGHSFSPHGPRIIKNPLISIN